MSPASPEAWDRDLPAGEDELWEAVADPSRRKVRDLILAHGQATPTACLTKAMRCFRGALLVASHDAPFLRASVSRNQYRKSKP
jgi:hypothetical protein